MPPGAWIGTRKIFFDKVRTIHQALCEALEFGQTRKHRLAAKDLLSLGAGGLHLFVHDRNESWGDRCCAVPLPNTAARSRTFIF
jgi:hypothetical protein